MNIDITQTKILGGPRPTLLKKPRTNNRDRETHYRNIGTVRFKYAGIYQYTIISRHPLPMAELRKRFEKIFKEAAEYRA